MTLVDWRGRLALCPWCATVLVGSEAGMVVVTEDVKAALGDGIREAVERARQSALARFN